MTLRPEGSEHYRTDATFDALDALGREAEERGVSMAALALAWLLHVPELTAIVVGPNTVEQLAPVIEALDVPLDDDEHARIGALFG
jgi:aryl-alcohol dehydrogenase-like predicted oxidoreductase